MFYQWHSLEDHFCAVKGVDAYEGKALTPHFFSERMESVARLTRIADQRGHFPKGDCAYTGAAQPKVLSLEAWDALSSILNGCGLVRDAVFVDSGEPLKLWKPSCVSDCLDESKSVIFETFTGFRKVHAAVFRNDVEIPQHPFVHKGFEQQDVWVDEKFVLLIKERNLTGFEFRVRSAPEISQAASQ